MTIGLSIVTMEGVLYKDGNGELSNFRRFADRSHVHQLVDTMLAEITLSRGAQTVPLMGAF